MRKDIHPETNEITAKCVCGNSFKTASTAKEISVDICAACHPFFTGTQKFVDTAGRIDKFQKRYKSKESQGAAKAATPGKQKKSSSISATSSAKATQDKKATTDKKEKK